MKILKTKLTHPHYLHRRAAQTLLAGAARASDAGILPLSMTEIQAEVQSVRGRAQILRLTR